MFNFHFYSCRFFVFFVRIIIMFSSSICDLPFIFSSNLSLFQVLMSARKFAESLQRADLLKSFTVKDIEYALSKMSPCKEEKCARTLIDANQYMNRLIRYEERLKKVIADMDQLRIEYKKTTAENGKLTAENEMLRADVQNLSRENEMQKTELARKFPAPSQVQQPSPPPPGGSSASPSGALNSNSNSPPTTKKQSTPTLKKKRPNEDCQQENATTSAACSSNSNGTVIAVGNNEEEEEFHMVKKSILKAAIMSFAASLANERDDLKIGAKKSEGNDRGDSANSGAKITVTAKAKLVVKTEPMSGDEPIGRGGPFSPNGTAATQADSGIMESINKDEADDGDNRSSASPPPLHPSAVKFIQDFEPFFMSCVKSISLGLYGVDTAIQSFCMYTLKSQMELVNANDGVLEAIIGNLKQFAMAIMKRELSKMSTNQ